MPQLWIIITLYSASLFSPLQHAAFRLHAEPRLSASSPSIHAFSADSILAYAATLMQQKEYYRAITEYRRFLYSFPHDRRRSLAHFRIGLAFYRGKDYEEALKAFAEVAESFPELPHGKLARLWQGECLVKQQEFEAAEHLYRAISLRSAGEKPGEHAVYRHAWTSLYRRKWQEAKERFESLPANNAFREAAHQIAEATPGIVNSRRKSPLMAGILSAALPGSGQLYIGRRGDAWLAFLLNGLFLAGIVEALNQDRPAVAGMLGLFEVGWYAGNIYGAANGARKYNLHQARIFIQKMEEQFPYEPPVSSPAAPLGLRLSLRF